MLTDRREHKKARIGEALVDEWLRAQGWVPYFPVFDGPHPFDRLVATPDKQRLAIVDVKTKPRRNAYADTGINLKHYDEYMRLMDRYQMPVFLAFVDENMAQIYGEFLSVLIQSRETGLECFWRMYPWREGSIIYFPVAAMKVLAPLTEEQCAALKSLRQTSFSNAKDWT